MATKYLKRILDAHGISYADLDGRVIAEGSYTERLGDDVISGVEFTDVTDWSGSELAAWLGY